jgi:hypothetical protein
VEGEEPSQKATTLWGGGRFGLRGRPRFSRRLVVVRLAVGGGPVKRSTLDERGHAAGGRRVAAASWPAVRAQLAKGTPPRTQALNPKQAQRSLSPPQNAPRQRQSEAEGGLVPQEHRARRQRRGAAQQRANVAQLKLRGAGLVGWVGGAVV